MLHSYLIKLNLVDHEYATIKEKKKEKNCCTCSREIVDIFPPLKKTKTTLTLAFLGHHESKIFQTLHGYNSAWGLHCHCRFEDLCFRVTGVSEV